MSLLMMFCIGGLMYIGIEVMYDGDSARSMGLIGGLAFVIGGSLDEWFAMPVWAICVVIAILVTILEFIGGKIFNRDYSIWDYRKMPFNIQGQVCLPFMIVWFFIAPLIIWLDNALRTVDYMSLLEQYQSMLY